MNTPSHKTDPALIHETKDGDRTYLLQCENNDIIFAQGKQIIADSKLSISVRDWLQEIDAMYKHVSDWIANTTHARIVGWAIVHKGSQLTLFFCHERKSFDFDLAQELAELSTYLARNYAVGPIELLQIPYKDRDRFIDPKLDLNNGNIGSARSSMAS